MPERNSEDDSDRNGGGRRAFDREPLRYRSRREGGLQIIEPDEPYLDTVRRGGPLPTMDFWYGPWDRRFRFPSLDIKVVNNTNRTVLFHEAILRVRRSNLDQTPVPIIKPEGYSRTLPLVNAGWGPMRDATLRFVAKPVFRERQPENAGPDAPREFVVRAGDVSSDRWGIEIGSCFEAFGVDVSTLEALEKARIQTDAWAYFDDKSAFGTPFDEPGPECAWLPGALERLGSPARRMARAEYDAAVARANPAGGLIRLALTGTLEYSYCDVASEGRARKHEFSTSVAVGEPGPGAPLPPSYCYRVGLEVDGSDYERSVPISHALPAGGADRFLIEVGALKSSIHDVQVDLVFDDGHRVCSAPIRLEIFVSTLDARFVKGA